MTAAPLTAADLERIEETARVQWMGAAFVTVMTRLCPKSRPPAPDELKVARTK